MNLHHSTCLRKSKAADVWLFMTKSMYEINQICWKFGRCYYALQNCFAGNLQIQMNCIPNLHLEINCQELRQAVTFPSFFPSSPSSPNDSIICYLYVTGLRQGVGHIVFRELLSVTFLDLPTKHCFIPYIYWGRRGKGGKAIGRGIF